MSAERRWVWFWVMLWAALSLNQDVMLTKPTHNSKPLPAPSCNGKVCLI